MIVANTISFADPLAEVIEANREAWLRDAELVLMRLDPAAYADGGTLHLIDFRQLGAPATGFLGFVAGAQLHELARDHLPVDAQATASAAVAVNVERIARITADEGPISPDAIGAAVAAVATHELAHVIQAQATGERLPEGATIEQVVRSLTDGRSTAKPHHSKAHSAGWCRAYLHLLFRSSRLPHADAWRRQFAIDIGAVLPLDPGTYLDALAPEIMAKRSRDRLVDILRTPAPAGFLKLFDSLDAAIPANEEL